MSPPRKTLDCLGTRLTASKYFQRNSDTYRASLLLQSPSIEKAPCRRFLPAQTHFTSPSLDGQGWVPGDTGCESPLSHRKTELGGQIYAQMRHFFSLFRLQTAGYSKLCRTALRGKGVDSPRITGQAQALSQHGSSLTARASKLRADLPSSQ